MKPRSDFRLSRDEMKSIGYAVVDQIIDHYEGIRDKKVLNMRRFEELDPLFNHEIPLVGEEPLKVLKHVSEDVFKNILHTDHPRFYAFIPAPTNFISAMADALAAGYNVFAGHWMSSSSAAKLEMLCIDWLIELTGFPKEGGGIFVSGGSMANMMSIMIAKNLKLEEGQNGTIYYSNQTHSSVEKGLRILGIPKKYYRPISTNSKFQIEMAELKSKIKRDVQKGLKPLCIIGNAGTTNTGAVDSLVEIAQVARENDVWFHVDGAYGAASIITERGKKELGGMELADSLTLDPHKWWFQTFETGCLLVREEEHLRATFHTSAEYLWDTKSTLPREKNFYDYGTQLTRSFRALKFYMSMKIYGIEVFKRAVERGFELAEYTQELLQMNPVWRIVSPAYMGIINFQYVPKKLSEDQVNELSKRISKKILDDGYAMIITTQLNGKTVLRMCPIHPELTFEELKETVQRLEEFAEESFEEITGQDLGTPA